jgi:hypothetical protein
MPLDTYVPVDWSQLPRVKRVERAPTLREILVLGWRYFLPGYGKW